MSEDTRKLIDLGAATTQTKGGCVGLRVIIGRILPFDLSDN
ncbi:hypothetical protein OF829_11770 [Sphingomonas sp. LB-2]|nr:hypothetical protein [Sphingomonas caeni]MCW3847919.1 hypothetical protein [Sphingomonas caeni]